MPGCQALARDGEFYFALLEVKTVHTHRNPRCEDVDECETDNGGCGHPLYTVCYNRHATTAACADINECETDNGGASAPLCRPTLLPCCLVLVLARACLKCSSRRLCTQHDVFNTAPSALALLQAAGIRCTPRARTTTTR